MRIMLVEDPARDDGLGAALGGDEYEISRVDCGADSRAEVRAVRPDLIIIDRDLPDMDGLQIVDELAERGPVIVTSRQVDSKVADTITALRLGADDFMLRPVDMEELRARVQAVLRRSEPRRVQPQRPTASDVVVVGDLRYWPARGVVMAGDKPLHLTPSELRIVALLMAKPDDVCTHQELFAEIWEHPPPDPNHVLNVFAGRIRDKFRMVGLTTPRMVTSHSYGYMLATQPKEVP